MQLSAVSAGAEQSHSYLSNRGQVLPAFVTRTLEWLCACTYTKNYNGYATYCIAIVTTVNITNYSYNECLKVKAFCILLALALVYYTQ